MKMTMYAFDPKNLILTTEENQEVSDETQSTADPGDHPVVSIAGVDNGADQYYEDDEIYCSECYDNILHWKVNEDEERGAQQFHLNLLALLECGKTCKLCGYICSLFGDTIQKYTDDHANLPVFHIAHDAQEPWITSDGTFRAVKLTVGVYPWEYRESCPGFRSSIVTTSAGMFVFQNSYGMNSTGYS
jgi:hypothetical protein